MLLLTTLFILDHSKIREMRLFLVILIQRRTKDVEKKFINASVSMESEREREKNAIKMKMTPRKPAAAMLEYSAFIVDKCHGHMKCLSAPRNKSIRV